MERINNCSYFRMADVWAVSSVVGKDEVGEVGRSWLDPGELCMVPFPYRAWGSLRDLNMEVSSSDFRRPLQFVSRALKYIYSLTQQIYPWNQF